MINEKFKKIYIAVLSCVTLFCVIWGSIYHIGRFFESNWLDFDFGGSYDSESTVSTVAIEDEFSSINVDIDISNLVIEYGDEAQVYYNYPESGTPEIEVKNGVLNVSFTSTRKMSSLKQLSDKYLLNITLPEGTKLKNCDIKVAVGNVELDNMDMDNLDVEADMGNVEVDGGNIGAAYGDLDMGNLEFDDVTMDKGDFDVSMGNCEINGAIKALSADVDMGNCEVNSTYDLDEMDLDLDCDMGSCTVNGKNFK